PPVGSRRSSGARKRPRVRRQAGRAAEAVAITNGNGITEIGRATAEEAGLRYVSDEWPGIRRQRRGKGFSYCGRDGQRITDEATLARIKRLAIPPAWTDVWISPDRRGHIQATGRDDRNRKQYRYHPDWQAYRDELKFHRILEFGRALPRIRETVKS